MGKNKQNLKGTRRFKARRQTITLLVGLMFIFFIPLVSALEFDNTLNKIEITKDSSVLIGSETINYKTIWEKYQPVKIDNLFGLGETIWSGAINEHTDSCSTNCHSTMDIYLANDGSLIDDVKFKTLQEDKSWVEQNVRSYQFYIKTGEKENIINDYEYQCKERLNINGSMEKYDCENVLIGNHIEVEELWEEYNLGENVIAGNYKIKLEGEKKPSRTVDWVIETQGKLIDEWAVWGGTIYSTGGVLTTATDTASITTDRGMRFIPNVNIENNWSIYIKNDGVVAVLKNDSYDNLSTVTIVSHVAIFDYNLIVGTPYKLMVGNNGVGYTADYRTAGAGSTSINSTWVNFTHEVGGNGFNVMTNTNPQGFTSMNFTGMNASIITLNSPIDYFNSSIDVVNFNCSVNVHGATITNISLWTNQSGTFQQENVTTGLTGAIEEVIWNHNLENEGNYIWNCQGCDSDGDCAFASSNYTVSVDTTDPEISVISPVGQIYSHAFGNNLSLNWSINDTNLDSCWFNYNGVNTILTCSNNATNFVPVVNVQSLILWANDSVGNINSKTANWTYNFVENSADYNSTSQETSTESFTLNLTTDLDVLSISSKLNYNGTEYTSTSSCSGGECLLSNTIDISLVTSVTELHSFYWNFTIYNGTDSVETISSTRTQNVSRIYLEQCNATWTTKSLNFTAYDEQSLARTDPFQFDGTFDFWIGSGSVKRNVSLSKNISEMNLCLSPNVTIKIDATIDYDEDIGTTYINRFYYFDEHSINNTLQHISMYLFNSSSATSFILKVQDENLLPVADALIEIYRYYPGDGIYRIVQIAKTDDNGKSVGFFQTETVDYKFIIKKNGETLLETGKQKVIPEVSPYTLTFNTGTDLGEPWSSQADIPSLESSLSFDADTGIVTYSYIDSSGNFTQARLFVQEQSLANSTDYTIICNDTSSLSSSTMTCNVGNESGFYMASSYITRTGEALDLQITFQIEDFSSVAGVLGLFFGWFLILIASFMFKFNEVAGIWATTITIFLVNIIGLIKFGGVFVTAIIGIAIILTWVMEK